MSQNNVTNNTNNTKKEFIDFVVDVRRVTKVTKGGKRFQFSAFVISGNGAGMIGMGKGKARDVSAAVAKATVRARKSLFEIYLRGNTLPYDVLGKHGACRVLLQPASKGTGLIAGGGVRLVAKALGIHDVLGKSLGTSRSDINVIKATLNALSKCRTLQHMSKLRGLHTTQIMKGSHHQQQANEVQ